jgi:PKD repeat protein
VDGTDHAGIRWYELRKTPPSTTWTMRQQGTYAPDASSRWMGSVMINGYNEIGLGYSISGSTVYPGIRFCGQTAAEYNNSTGILDFPEGIIHEGTASQTGVERWGDYSQLSVDPIDDGTFWFSTEYIEGGRKTKIASFQVGPVAPSARFIADNTLPCKSNTIVSFTTTVTGIPTQYAWKFSPPAVTYTDGTDSTSHNPKVIFDKFGSYTVSLTVTNNTGSRTTTNIDYIQVNNANADFTASSTLVIVDYSTTFNDASTCNASSWLWDFGVGALPPTANTRGPHKVTYDSTGLKTITLTVNGNNTKTKTGFVNVIEPNITMSNATVSTCSAKFYDPGGPSANYPVNSNYSMLFMPGIAGSKLEAVFTTFKIEPSTNCARDYLLIYDGLSTSATLIGKYCSVNSPGTVTATNPDGALLFVFISNSITTFEGWSANIACTAIPVTNPTLFSATAQSSSKINLAWTRNPDTNNVLLAWSADSIFGIPENGKAYTAGSTIPGGGIVLSSGAESKFNHTNLLPSTHYYYKAFSYNTDKKYSSGVTTNATTLQKPTLSVSPQEISVTSPAGTAPVNISSNTGWTASCSQTWCSVKSSGTGTMTISADYLENFSVSSRTATITITAAELPQVSVTLIQAGAAPILTVAPSNQNVSDQAGNIAFTVTSNTSWQASSDQAWCVVSNSGTGNGTINATFTQNLSINSRFATITVNVAGIPATLVKVTQAGAAPILTVSPEIRNVNAYAASTDFAVTSNTSWTAAADSAWCTVTPSGSGNGIITAVYPWNPTKKVRSTKISVQAAGVTTRVATLIQGQETASVGEVGSKGLSIYPNPAKGVFSIVADKTKYPAMLVTITDSRGLTILARNCKGESEYPFDLSGSPQGTYMVKVQTEKEFLIIKLVILR